MRERVFGIETEYAVIYHPPRAGGRAPNKFTLYRHFEQALRRRVPSLPNAFSPFREKVGRFLANGGTFHYEATMEHLEHGLIEMASPECRDPLTLLHYERAKDELIEELAGEVNQVLELSGARGEVRIGKNNVDSQGHGFGSHENYWVEDPLAPAALGAFAVLWLGVWAVSLPVLAFVLAVRIVATAALLGFGLGLAVSMLVVGLLRPRAGLRLRRFADRLGQRFEERPGEIGRYLQRLVAPVYPLFALHSALYNLFHFRPFRRSLTAFLVTRIVYTGAGAVSFDGGPLLHLSQRAPFLRVIARIFSDGERRPIYETRDLFFRPWSALRSRRRLHLLVGEANLCEQALLLRVGATALVLEAIEARVDVDWPVLADPLAALRTLSERGLEAELELADGTRARAVEIQRRYLAAARRALRDGQSPAAGTGPPPGAWKERVLRDWRETLDLLDSDPSALADRVDWIAKRELVHAEVPDAGDREALLRQEDAAAIIGVSPRALEGWRYRGGGPKFVRISARCIRYRRGDVLAWIEDRVATSTSEDPTGGGGS